MAEPVLVDKGHGTCGCGSPADKTSSGSPECWPCWNWRKLDGPAARHWADVATTFLSNVDTYDLTYFFDKCGVDQAEATTMILAARKIRDASKAGIEARRMPDARLLDERVPE